MKKSVKILIGLICLVCLMWGLYKIYLLHYYKIDYNSYIIKCLNNIQELSINTNKNLANENFYNMNIYIPENLEDEKFNSENNKVYTLNNTPQIWITKDTETLNQELEQSDFKKTNFEKILNKYNITTRIDLIKYYESHIKEKRNIFWNKSHIQMDYISANYIIQFSEYGQNENYYYLKNGISGLMKQDSSFTTAIIFKDDDIYTIRFNNISFNINEIQKILSSISFK